MDTEQNVDQASSPFAKVKARHLVGWLLATFPMLLISIAVTHDSAIESVWVYAWVYVVPIAWFLLRARRKGLRLAGLAGTWPKSAGWVKYILLNIPVLLLSLGSIVIIYGLISRTAPHVVEGLLSTPKSEIEAVIRHPLFATLLELFGALILAPIAEEFIFRGFLLHRWTAKWGVVRAMVLVSILFGILHINFFGAAVFSLVLCVVYLHTRSIWPGVVMHLVNNLLSSWPSATSEVSPSAGDLQASFVVGWIIMIISLPVLVWFIWRHWPAKNIELPYFIKKDVV